MIEIDMNDYDYELPEEKIAQYPLEKREASHLLLYNGKEISRENFKEIDKFIPSGSLIVFNNTRVIRARILFRKETGANIEVFCLEPLLPAGYELSFGSQQPVEWKCIVGNLRKWQSGSIKTEISYRGEHYELTAEKLQPESEAWRIRFGWNSKNLTFSDVLESAGHIPLPPYIEREDEENDYLRYQTVYSSIKGSVAAPTAGLHFTDKILKGLKTKGIKLTELTLHIGAGTFQPVRSGGISQHEMHTEHFFVEKATIESLIENQGKIIAVGTTTVRTLESLYWSGIKVLQNKIFPETGFIVGQWEPYELRNNITVTESLGALLDTMSKTNTNCLCGSTRMIIIPGYNFKILNGLITNFHMPRSTLLLLISAWTGPDWKKIYKFALENNFRFLSYGDSSLLLR